MADAVLDEIFDEIAQDRHCADPDCDRKLVSPWTWRSVPTEERAEMMADGWFQEGRGGSGYCARCWSRKQIRERNAT